mmetsp:Transcript_27380/g.89603  ORF Transcript_27380/g.89603 Transcript_27380/m.89603 type:complete len:227 (+) Transcript_27380:220-900(+)
MRSGRCSPPRQTRSWGRFAARRLFQTRRCASAAAARARGSAASRGLRPRAALAAWSTRRCVGVGSCSPRRRSARLRSRCTAPRGCRRGRYRRPITRGSRPPMPVCRHLPRARHKRRRWCERTTAAVDSARRSRLRYERWLRSAPLRKERRLTSTTCSRRASRLLPRRGGAAATGDRRSTTSTRLARPCLATKIARRRRKRNRSERDSTAVRLTASQHATRLVSRPK